MSDDLIKRDDVLRIVEEYDVLHDHIKDLSAVDPVVIHQVDPAAIREAALREAVEVRIAHPVGYEFIPTRFRDAILALIGEKNE
jgi:hypothetical protein